MNPKSYYDFDLCTVDTSKTEIAREAEWLRMIANAKVTTDYSGGCGKRARHVTYDESIIPKSLIDESCSKTNISREEAEEIMKRFVKTIYGIPDDGMVYPIEIEKVIFNDPATIVFWSDGTKTVVKCANEEFDKEKGLAMAICKRVLGNKGNYFNEFRKWIKED